VFILELKDASLSNDAPRTDSGAAAPELAIEQRAREEGALRGSPRLKSGGAIIGAGKDITYIKLHSHPPFFKC